MNKGCVFISIVVYLVLAGCDTIHPSGRLSPWVDATGSVPPGDKPTLVPNTELISRTMPYSERELYREKKFDAYHAGKFAVQALGAGWAKNVVGIQILVKNSGSVPRQIPLGRAAFVPREVRKAWHRIGAEYSPTIAYVYFGPDQDQTFIIPEDVEPEDAFLRTAKSSWSNVHNAVEIELQYYLSSFQGTFTRGKVDNVSIAPGGAAYVYLVFPVGFVERGDLAFPVDEVQAVRFEFSEAGFMAER